MGNFGGYIFPDDDYDRVSVNESDGMTFYGYDDSDTGRTTWYTEDGTLDCVTDTPYDEDDF